MGAVCGGAAGATTEGKGVDSNVASDGRQDTGDDPAAAAPAMEGAADAIVVDIEEISGIEDMEEAPGSTPATEDMILPVE